jgi:hypothetical protein
MKPANIWTQEKFVEQRNLKTTRNVTRDL